MAQRVVSGRIGVNWITRRLHLSRWTALGLGRDERYFEVVAIRLDTPRTTTLQAVRLRGVLSNTLIDVSHAHLQDKAAWQPGWC